MKLVKNLLIALLLAPVLASAESEDFKAVSMNEVPEHVVKAANSVKPGSYITRIYQLLDNDNLTYQFYASQVGRYWVIVVRDDGEVLEVYESPSAPPSLANSSSDD